MMDQAAASPVDGKANAAVDVLVAELLGVPPIGGSVISGGSSRNEKVAVSGLSVRKVRKAVGYVLSSGTHEPG